MSAGLPEHHRTGRIGWLRAAVLGANDGIISTSSLMIGVAAAATAPREIIVAGVAGMAAGAVAMAAGEYVSVSSQADTERAELELERSEIARNPVGELQELAEIFEKRGLTPELAGEVARQLTKVDALAAHAREELGFSETLSARPVQAALASAASFAVGASLPLIVSALAPATHASWIIAGSSLVSLAALGAVAASVGGAAVVFEGQDLFAGHVREPVHGSSHRGKLRGLVWNLALRVPYPTLRVRTYAKDEWHAGCPSYGERDSTMTREIKTILVPTDFGPHSDEALEFAAMVARRFDAEIHLVHACGARWLSAASVAEAQLKAAARRVHGLTVYTEVLFGEPANCILAAATATAADLIVMGTHGHDPRSVPMGSVAEEMVRTAPCSVLTVRGRNPVDWYAPKPVRTGAFAAATLGLAMMLSPATITVASAQATVPPSTAEEMRQTDAGAETFRTYCVVCHGAQGRGDGALAASMKKKPADLTELAKRNGGEYPTEMVYRTIDGKQPIRGHGGPDMPVWGDAFMKSRAGGSTQSVKETIDTLVAFIGSIQVRPGH